MRGAACTPFVKAMILTVYWVPGVRPSKVCVVVSLSRDCVWYLPSPSTVTLYPVNPPSAGASHSSVSELVVLSDIDNFSAVVIAVIKTT